MSRPVHFEIHADDTARAAAFYASMFNWKITKWDGPFPYWVIRTGDGVGVDGGLMQRMGPPPAEGQPVNSWVMTVDVPSCDAAIADGLAHGGTLALAKMAVQGVGYVAYLKDTEGNIFGVMQHDPTVT